MISQSGTATGTPQTAEHSPAVGQWSGAPTPPPPPPPQAAAPAESGPRVPTTAAGALDEMTEVIRGVRGALLASVDGFALAQSKSMPSQAAHAAMLAAAIGLAHQLLLIGGGRQLRQLVVDHDNGLLLLWPIGDTRVLAVLTESIVDQTQLRQFVGSRAALMVAAK